MIQLAHAGGWDEIMSLLLPAVVFFFVLQFRRKRMEGRSESVDEAEDDATKEASGR